MSDSQPVDGTANKIDGHRLAEFIYGTVTGMVALAGLSGGSDASWWSSASIVIVGAVAIWIAHGYSILISKRVLAGHRLLAKDISSTFAGSWPIVIAGAILSIPFFLVPLGLIAEAAASKWASGIGVLILALVGILAGAITNETWLRRLLIAFVSAGLGVLVVLVEYGVHH